MQWGYLCFYSSSNSPETWKALKAIVSNKWSIRSDKRVRSVTSCTVCCLLMQRRLHSSSERRLNGVGSDKDCMCLKTNCQRMWNRKWSCPCPCHECIEGGRGKAPVILNLGDKNEWSCTSTRPCAYTAWRGSTSLSTPHTCFLVVCFQSLATLLRREVSWAFRVSHKKERFWLVQINEHC
jgi:hypothetical protein